ncbi:MAG TPA: acyl-CoA thioesterase [Gemmatimonadaceae bacterium]|nr:acyl-CoA thioesterase [Gemmatimonadaceae bacterium]
MPRRLSILALVALLAVACRAADRQPASMQFLVVAGDSTFWVHSGPPRVQLRGSPIQLAYYGGRFYEVYVVDDDRSYTNAVIVGQAVYRRDLISNDSALVFTDTAIAKWDQWYGENHPDDRPLLPDEESSDDPVLEATSELDLVSQYGPYLSYAYRGDADAVMRRGWHMNRRGVLDLRTGRQMTLAALFGSPGATMAMRQGAMLLARLEDSVRASRDRRAPRARRALRGFRLDSTSFTITTVGGAPAVAFGVPGRGRHSGGRILALPPVRVPAPPWWREVQRSLPTPVRSGAGDEWRHRGARLAARYDRARDVMTLSLVDSLGHRWSLGAFPPPVHHIFWLDAPDVDSTALRALDRAFDDAALYSDDARTAMIDPLPSSIPAEATPVDRPSRPVRESQHETSEIMMPHHANAMGHVFGGVILSMLDRTAAVSAIRHARQQCVTVSVDRVDFREPIHVGDLVVMRSSVNYAGRTSMEVGVRVEAENLLNGVRRHTNSCYVTFVAIDRNGRPVTVPAVHPETDTERRRYTAAQERRRRRLEEREAERRGR